MIIKLQRNLETIIDDEDYDLVKDYRWCGNYDSKLDGYYVAARVKRSNGRRTVLKMHRLIMGATKGELVDHINHDTLDNRRSNLRICNESQNQCNSGKYSNNTSGYKGVSCHKGINKFRARVNKNCKEHCLGYFNTALEASTAYEKAAKELHGEFYYQTTD